jgi:hypothetical protein
MKLSLVISLAAGLVAAADPARPEQPGTSRSFRKRSITVEKYEGEYTLRAADKPATAPIGYDTAVAFPSEERSAEWLHALPVNVQRRHESFQAQTYVDYPRSAWPQDSTDMVTE